MPLVLMIVITLSDGGARMQAAGDRAWAEGRFEAAREAYLTAWRAGRPADCLAQQLGNTCYVLGRTAEALYFYRCAQVAWPRSAELAAAVRLVQRALGHRPRAPSGLVATLGSLPAFVTLAEALVVASAAGALLGVLTIAGMLARGKPARRARGLGWLRRGLAIGLLLLALVVALRLAAAPPVMVGVAGASLVDRAEHGRLVARVAPGTEGRLLEEVSGWSRVALAGGAEGWIRSDLLWRLPRHDLEAMPADL